MSSTILKAAQNRPHLTFVPLFYSLAGWGLAHAWLVLINASSRVHIIFALVPALVLVGVSARRASTDIHTMKKEGPAVFRTSRWTCTRGALLLLFLGAAFGFLVVNGSTFLLAMAALALGFVPATRLPFTTHKPGLPVLIMGIGFLAVILPGFPYIDFMALPLATWAFWLCACCPLLLRIEQVRRAERVSQAEAVSVGADVRTASCDG